MNPAFQGRPDFGKFFFGNRFKSFLFCFKVDKKEYGHIIEKRGENGDLDNVQIRGVGKFCHQKGSCPHDGRHELSACGCGRLNGPGHMGFVTDFFHHGDGK